MTIFKSFFISYLASAVVIALPVRESSPVLPTIEGISLPLMENGTSDPAGSSRYNDTSLPLSNNSPSSKNITLPHNILLYIPKVLSLNDNSSFQSDDAKSVEDQTLHNSHVPLLEMLSNFSETNSSGDEYNTNIYWPNETIATGINDENSNDFNSSSKSVSVMRDNLIVGDDQVETTMLNTSVKLNTSIENTTLVKDNLHKNSDSKRKPKSFPIQNTLSGNFSVTLAGYSNAADGSHTNEQEVLHNSSLTKPAELNMTSPNTGHHNNLSSSDNHRHGSIISLSGHKDLSGTSTPKPDYHQDKNFHKKWYDSNKMKDSHAYKQVQNKSGILISTNQTDTDDVQTENDIEKALTTKSDVHRDNHSQNMFHEGQDVDAVTPEDKTLRTRVLRNAQIMTSDDEEKGVDTETYLTC